MKDWMVFAAEIMVLIASFLLLCYVIVWMLTNQDKVAKWHIETPAKDPRWKNRKQIIDFIFITLTALITTIIAIIGATL